MLTRTSKPGTLIEHPQGKQRGDYCQKSHWCIVDPTAKGYKLACTAFELPTIGIGFQSRRDEVRD
jgi:hypothetical protein